MLRLPIRFLKNCWTNNWLVTLAALLLVIGVIGTAVRSLTPKDANAIHIAVMAPLTGSRYIAGKEMVQSIQLYLDSVNQEGGVNGHPLKLLVFDDKADPETALWLMRKVNNSPALVVLGHLTSTTAIATGPVYQALQIPAITSTASADRVTQANPYYFRTVFTDSVQGSVLALYAQQALNFKTASVIYSDDHLGHTLREAFEATFKRSGTIKHSWQFDPKANNLEQSVKTIVDELAADPDAGMVLMAMEDVVASDFIVAMRRRGLKTTLLGNDTFHRETFPQLFEQYEEEKERPGYFLDGMYIATSLIFDSASADAQEFASTYQKTYHSPPHYVGAGYYDAARVAVEAIRSAKLENTTESRKRDRQQIRDRLKAIDSRDAAIRGLSSPIYFDVTNDNTPPVRIGQFVNRRLISAPIQLAPVTNLALVDVDREIKAGNIVQLIYQTKNQYFWKQRVVYTGIDINKVSRVDQSKSSFTTDFYLWMRYSGEDNATLIEFPNGVANSLNSNAPLFDPTAPIRSDTIDGLNYRLYQIRGEFKGSYDFRDYPFDRQKLAIRFQNTRVPSDRLIYVIDTFGLKLPHTDPDMDKKPYQSLQLWSFKDIQYAQETFSSTSTKGNPRLFASNLRVDYPGLSATITLQRKFTPFLIKNLLPLSLLIAVLYSTLFFSENLAKERLTVAISALLSSAVLLTAINAQLSDTGYTVAIEYGFYVFFALCLFCILVGLVIERLRLAGRKHGIEKLNTFARIFYPIVVLTTVVCYALAFGNRF